VVVVVVVEQVLTESTIASATGVALQID